MGDAVEASTQRVRSHLGRPLAASGNLLMQTARNTVSETDPPSMSTLVVVWPCADIGVRAVVRSQVGPLDLCFLPMARIRLAGLSALSGETLAGGMIAGARADMLR